MSPIRREPFTHAGEVRGGGRDGDVIRVAFDAEGLADHREPLMHLMSLERIARNRGFMREHRASRIADEPGSFRNARERDPQCGFETVWHHNRKIEMSLANLRYDASAI